MSQSSFTLGISGVAAADASLPAALQTASRGMATPSGAGIDPFINASAIKAKVVFELARPARGNTESPRTTQTLVNDDVIALEAADGATIFMRADRLQAEAARLMPQAIDANGQLNIDQLRDTRVAASRGAVGDWLWRRVSVLEILPDEIVEAARTQLRAWLGNKAKDTLIDSAKLSATRLGTKALLAAIENRLPRGPGLYRWRDGSADKLEPVQEAALPTLGDKPLLVFIHGPGSNTSGCFGELGKADAGWNELVRRYADNIYAFEHRSFSESPLDNALSLAASLPKGARLSLVTHSSGGLVGDLLCIASLNDQLIANWQRPATDSSSESPDALQQIVDEEHAKLVRLRDLLNTKNLQVERYVRVASPARGTLLAGGNFDVFMSTLLNLIGLVPALAGSPLYSALKRIVLEIVHNRTDPAWVPGIEAMLPNSPYAQLLATAERQRGVQMAVIAGDIESGSVLQRLGVMFTDWMFFDTTDNDLIVDTDSMFAGLARSPNTRYLFQQGATINHFSYFHNSASRQAVKEWLTHDDPAALSSFELIPLDGNWAAQEKAEGRKRDAQLTRTAPNTRPVVYVVPGIMGSHLARVRTSKQANAQNKEQRDRVWFNIFGLATGALKKIAWPNLPPVVQPDGLFGMFYGDCCTYLSKSHEVVTFPYDWRLPLKEEADRLAAALRLTLAENPDQPIRILAHSMGGLLTRAMIAAHPDVWQQIVKRSGGRLIFIGTPNNGSHLMVEMLLGKGDSLRKLAQLDLTHNLQELLDIVAGFRGALQLLPRPGFLDTGATSTNSSFDFFDTALWENFKTKVFDRWFGNHVVAIPAKAALDEAKALWALLPDNKAPQETDRVAYVFGSGAKTTCGVEEKNGQINLIGTALGDGSVTWQSGRLDGLPDNRHWYMPAEHGDLLNTSDYFDAIGDLLLTGETRRLPQTAPRSRAAGVPETFLYDAGPAPIPTEDELARSVLGSRAPRQRRRGTINVIEICVRAQDLRFAQSPVLCGHYRGDAISGAEDQLDRNVVAGALRQRDRLGMYAGAIGTSALALASCSDEERRRGSQRGALVVGLGEYGSLAQRQLVDTVRAGTLRFLLHYQELHPASGASVNGAAGLTLSPLLIGFSSTSNLSLENSIEAIILGVAEANNQFASAKAGDLRISRLEFTELFLDSAISATRALPSVASHLQVALSRLDTRLQLATELDIGMGARTRLQSSSGDNSYWARLLVTDADSATATTAVTALTATPTTTTSLVAPTPKLAERLKFVFLSTRARAECEVQQRQPGLIEVLVKKSIDNADFNLDHCRSLYELMVPLDFKGIASNVQRLLLVVDGYTANLPWEMLVADGTPMVVNTAMIRQLATDHFRKGFRTTQEKTAYVIGNPSTAGFLDRFSPLQRSADNPDGSLAPLPGAEDEATAIASLLRSSGYAVPEPSIGPHCDALKVIGGLYRQPWRIIHIAAHGIFNAMDTVGQPRTGVVLSDGLLLTAAEIGQLDIVPDLVFLNCCHLGVADNLPREGNRIAYSLARELIEMGVRCVVVAGWAVNDDAARLFSETLYTQMIQHNEPFGAAIFQARREVYEQRPDCNTWGAYQAYGDPMFRFAPQTEATSYSDNWQPVSWLELIDAIDCETTRINARVSTAQQSINSSAENAQCARRVQQWVERSAAAWGQRPDVQYALGRFYADLGPAYFATAIAAYRIAVEGGSDKLSAPIKAIEQLANLEVRLGIENNDEPLINGALQRLRGLLVDGMQTRNLERRALLGSVAKSAALAKTSQPRVKWKDLAVLLTQARDAYAHDKNEDGVPRPYHTINRVQLDAMLGKLTSVKAREQAESALTDAADAARQSFTLSSDFFDAVIPVDAELTKYLLNDALAQAKIRKAIIEQYQQAITNVPHNQRQLNSVARQLRFMASVLQVKEAQDKTATALVAIAHALETLT